MKALTIVMAVTAIGMLMAGCQGNYKQEAQADMTSSPDSVISSTAAIEPLKDSSRKFIRTSDMKFRVKDVAKATDQIEDITRNFNGFVTYTHLESTTEDKKVTQMSADSALETIHYSVVNNMTIRVPNVKLDSTLRAIATLVEYLEYRTIKADDVALQIKANVRTQARALDNGTRVRAAIDNRGRKLNETTDAELLASNRQKEVDDAIISNLSLQDQVNYSTVSLALYQRTATRQFMIATDNSDQYRPGLGLRLWESVKAGWHFVEDIFVFFTRLWLLLLIGITGFIIYKKYKSKKLVLKA